ncbi:PREDICTED: natural killer cell receptor 2B4 isoform X2 [Hipposideros armiger]|nr:PREDICTED: natural killer cell receptor 2B4 isoform X2 [Hipposideros armiger]
MMSGSVEWKVRLHSEPGMRVILEWKNASESDPVNWVSNNSNNRFSFMTKDLTLLINATQLQDSGLYSLEVTNIFGEVSTHKFCVSVFDHVGKPRLLEQWGALDRGVCQVTLSCSVSRGGNVSYAWYRGSDLIQTARNLSILEERIDPKDMHTYTCNVSNPVSWDSQTLRLTQGCLSAQQNFSFLLFLVTVVLLVTLSLSVLGCFFVHRRKRKQLQPSPEEVLTIYEQVHNLPVRRNHAPRGPSALRCVPRLDPGLHGPAICLYRMFLYYVSCRSSSRVPPEKGPPSTPGSSPRYHCGFPNSVHACLGGFLSPLSSKFTLFNGRVRPWGSWSPEDGFASAAWSWLEGPAWAWSVLTALSRAGKSGAGRLLLLGWQQAGHRGSWQERGPVRELGCCFPSSRLPEPSPCPFISTPYYTCFQDRKDLCCFLVSLSDLTVTCSKYLQYLQCPSC